MAPRYGIAYFNVDPGTTPGGQTTITITYYHTSLQPSGTRNIPSSTSS